MQKIKFFAKIQKKIVLSKSSFLVPCPRGLYQLGWRIFGGGGKTGRCSPTLSLVLCPLCYVLCSMSFVLCSTSYILCPLSCVLCPMSFVFCPMSFFLYYLSSVLIQYNPLIRTGDGRGFPCLVLLYSHIKGIFWVKA